MTLKLLGEPRYLQEGEAQRLPAEHPLLLLTYLNAHETWISRQEILRLFYTDEAEGVARNKLRQLLFRAKKQRWFNGLEARPQHLKHSAPTDLRRFREAVEKGSWADAVAAYGGPLLRNTPVTDLPAYEAWLDNERQDVDGSFEEAAFWHAKELEENGEYSAACQVLSRLLAKDPLNEEAMQAYLRNALHGEPAKALGLYRQFKANLARDLSMEPLGETIELAEQLEGLADAPSAQSVEDVLETPLTPTLHNQPGSLTPFVGRELERGYLLGLLEQGSRLVTLMGLGGIGKTRLALVTAAAYAKELEHGGVFVPLASVASADLVPGAVLSALGLEPSAQRSPTEQVTDYLKDEAHLLVLDNFEHLMATAFVQTLLAAAPRLRVLVTSRERLKLSQEQVFELVGMALPPNLDEDGGLETFDAVKLFLKSARRNDPTFTLGPENRQAIFDLCQVLQGVPLALELAASWLRLMSVGEILSEAEQSFDLLESDFSDLPARHQSLRAVFESSWRLLSAVEQTTLTPLAIFAGGFTLEAAKVVTGASPRVLLKLVNKSLLRREQTGRFAFLEVVRQYAREKLELDAELYTKTAKAHADYYRNLSEAAAPTLKGGPEQLEGLNLLEADHANLRRGLEHYLDTNDVGSALRFANALFDYWFIRGHWNETQRLYERILVLSDPNLVRERTRAIVNTGYIATVQGHYKTATDLLEQSVTTFREGHDKEGLAYALLCAGLNANYQAQYETAEKLYEESLAVYKSLDDKRGIANVLHELGVVTIRRAQFERASTYLREALELRQDLKDNRGASRTLANLGIIARRQGDYETTEALYAQSLALSRSSNDQLGTANTLISFGVLVKLQGRYAEAGAAYTEALDIFQQTGDRFGEAVILENKATLYRLQQQYLTAREYGEACLQSHRERGDSWGVARALAELGFTAYAQSNIKASVGYFLEARAIAQDLKDRQLLTHSLRGLSASLSQTSHTALSCICLSLATRLIEALNIVLVPAEQEQIGSVKTRLINLLGSEKFAQHWAMGQRLTQDELFGRIEKLDLAALPETSVV